MHQISRPVPSGTRQCAAGHHPHLVESRGTPTGRPLFASCPSQYHVECSICGTATVPTLDEARALRRWNRGLPTIYQIPLSELGHVRQRVFDILAA